MRKTRRKDDGPSTLTPRLRRCGDKWFHSCVVAVPLSCRPAERVWGPQANWNFSRSAVFLFLALPNANDGNVEFLSPPSWGLRFQLTPSWLPRKLSGVALLSFTFTFRLTSLSLYLYFACKFSLFFMTFDCAVYSLHRLVFTSTLFILDSFRFVATSFGKKTRKYWSFYAQIHISKC